MSKYHYTGFFLVEDDKQKFEAICKDCREQFQSECLIEPIGEPHITVQHESDPSFTDDETLFGLTAKVEVVGYGNDGVNEALQVRFIRTEDPRVNALINETVNRVGEDKVHITVSKSGDAKSVNSKNLKFMSVSGNESLTLKYSGLLNKQVLDSSKAVSGDLLVFIPYLINKNEEFKKLAEKELSKDDINDYCKYVYKYSFNSRNSNTNKCNVYSISKTSEDDEIHMSEARIFFFERTNLAILCIMYSFAHLSINEVAQLCRNKRKFKENDLINIENQVFGKVVDKNIAEAFFFVTKGHDMRANVLLRLDVPLLAYPAYTEADSFYQRKLLYHFRGDGYVEKHYEPSEQDDEEIWPMDPLKVWGISSSTAVCLTCSQRGNKEHLLKTYPVNFKKYYCFLYVYLLHQKYFLYYLCDNISYNSSMDELNKYDEMLTLFSNEYLYKCISDVDQYQGLYVRVQKVFNIWEQLEDTQGPFEKLNSLKEKEIDIKRSRAESIINGTLFVLTFLTLISVLSDMFQLDESLRWVVNNFDLANPSYKQTCFIIIMLLACTILSFLIYLIYKWLKKEKSENTNL